jgi:hypothetical protein
MHRELWEEDRQPSVPSLVVPDSSRRHRVEFERLRIEQERRIDAVRREYEQFAAVCACSALITIIAAALWHAICR